MPKRTAAPFVGGGNFSSSVQGPVSTAIPESIYGLSQKIGPVVYFLRTDSGAIKIGTTDGWLDGRLRWSKATWTDLLVITPGYLDEERAFHERFEPYALGHELFEPAPEIFQVINEIRANYGLSAVEPWS